MSGSLITARLALEQGREVFAVPGRAGEANAQGTNRLIRDGAALVERGVEVAQLIAERLPVAHKTEMAGLSGIDVDKDSPLLSAMKGQDAVCIDWLVRQTNLGASQVLETLTKLVIAGSAVELPGRRFRLKGS
jgi:DNA processing protein